METKTTFEHGHCPHGCEHPQPFAGEDGTEYCGRCWFKGRVLTEMVPCTPETCTEVTPNAEPRDRPQAAGPA